MCLACVVFVQVGVRVGWKSADLISRCLFRRLILGCDEAREQETQLVNSHSGRRGTDARRAAGRNQVFGQMVVQFTVASS
jgi:hypothetical protein